MDKEKRTPKVDPFDPIIPPPVEGDTGYIPPPHEPGTLPDAGVKGRIVPGYAHTRRDGTRDRRGPSKGELEDDKFNF